MNEKDRILITEAFTTSDWNVVAELEKQATDEGAKLILHDRMVFLYHKEESFANQI